MKKLAILVVLIFSLVFSSTSFAKWKKVTSDLEGNTYYVDFERIRKQGGYVYFWTLSDFFRPTRQGYLSWEFYSQGDCKMFRYKSLNSSYYVGPLGFGPSFNNNKPDRDWKYPPPNNVMEEILKLVCLW